MSEALGNRLHSYGNGVDMEFRELWENIVDGVHLVILLR